MHKPNCRREKTRTVLRVSQVQSRHASFTVAANTCVALWQARRFEDVRADKVALCRSHAPCFRFLTGSETRGLIRGAWVLNGLKSRFSDDLDNWKRGGEGGVGNIRILQNTRSLFRGRNGACPGRFRGRRRVLYSIFRARKCIR